MISLILPKLIRSVARDGICDLFYVAGFTAGPLFLLNDTRQARCRSTANLPNFRTPNGRVSLLFDL